VARSERLDVRTLIPWVVTLAVVAAVPLFVPSVLPPAVRAVIGRAPERLAPDPQVADVGAYAFLAHQPGKPDEPVGYDPCRPIHVRVNLDQAPADGLDMVRAAMEHVGTDTGLRFEYDGLTDDRPHWKTMHVPSFLGRPRTRPVLVSWARADEVGPLSGAVAGIGGSVPAPDASGTLRFVTGGITLDADAFEELGTTEVGKARAYAIVLHEFGHLVGLAHVPDEHELMYAENVGVLDYGPGDLAGLARVGATSCG